MVANGTRRPSPAPPLPLSPPGGRRARVEAADDAAVPVSSYCHTHCRGCGLPAREREPRRPEVPASNQGHPLFFRGGAQPAPVRRPPLVAQMDGLLRPPLCLPTAPARPCAPQPQGTRRSRCLPVRLRTVSRPSVALPRGRRRECPKVRHGLLPRPEREAVPPGPPGDVAKTRGVQQRHRPGGGARRRGARLDFLPPSLPRMHRRPHSQPSGRHGGVSKIASKPANCSARS